MEGQILNDLQNIDFHFDKPFAKSIRDEAANQLSGMRFPTTRDEYWKYTRVNHWVEKNYKIGAHEGAVELSNVPLLEGAPKLVFVNGFYKADLSDAVSGVEVMPLSEAKEKELDAAQQQLSKLAHKDEVFTQVNAAYHNDGFFCHFKESVDQIQFVFVNTNDALANPRNLVIAEAEVRANLYEVHVNGNGAGSLSNVVTEYFVGRNAKLNITRLIKVGEDAGFISNEYATQEEGSDFTANTFCIGGKTVRNNLNIDLEGSFTETAMYGFYFNNDGGHTDNHTLINHKKPSCNSNELYKGVLDDSATGVFNGKVNVFKDAQQTNAFQSNNNILLSDDATVNSKPELEIYADDVKCSHGSTTGQMDENALFYLQARGISRDSAQRMMLSAFAQETTERIVSDELRELVSNEILASMQS